MTERLYYTDPRLEAFAARVEETRDQGRRLYLDRTAFYPTSGGQPHDTGTLAGVPVLDVVDEGERIAHVLAEPAAAAGEEVEGRIDWPRRFDHMQQHTGQHLLSAIFSDAFGLETVSVHFGEDASTLDLTVHGLDPAMLLEAEARANAAIWEDRPVTVGFEDADAAMAAGLRKPTEREGRLRVVAIEGLDRSACGGTHVESTGRIGAILLRRTERIRSETRVEFLCGGRAIRRARADFAALTLAARVFSAPIDEVPALVESQQRQLRTLQSDRKSLDQELAAFRARDLYERTPPAADGVRRAVHAVTPGAADELRALALAFTALPKALLVGSVESPPVVLLATSEDSGIEAGTALRCVLDELGGRGGGSARIAQGSLPDAAALARAVELLAG